MGNIFFNFFAFGFVSSINLKRFGVFIVNFKQISHLFLVFLLLNLNK